MAMTRCGAEMQALLKVGDEDAQTIFDVIDERVKMGVPQTEAERQAVREAMAQLRQEKEDLKQAIRDQIETPQMKRADEEAGILTEAAPNPDQKEAAGKWNRIPLKAKMETTRAVANRVMGRVFDELGLKGWSAQVQSGMFEGKANPNIVVSAPKGATAAQLDEAARVIGYVLDQKAIITFDESNTSTGNQVGFVKVTLPDGMSTEKVAAIREHVARIANVAGDTLIDGELIYGNFEGAQGFREAILSALESFDSNLTAQVSQERASYSSYIESTDGFLKGTRYEDGEQEPEAGRDDLRGEQGRGPLARLQAIAKDAIGLRDRWVDASQPRGGPSDSPVAGQRGGAGEQPAQGADYGITRQGDSGKVSVRQAVHYGNIPGLEKLSADRHGSGLRGAERERLEGADPRIRRRVYFYLPAAGGIYQGEAGVGGFVYKADLPNLYDIRSQKIKAPDANAFETAVLDAGFDGYIYPDQKMAVVLDRDVLVERHGKTSDHKIVPRYSRLVSSPEDIDSLGAFNLDSIDWDGAEQIELETDPNLTDAYDWGEVKPAALKKAGILAESAFPRGAWGEDANGDFVSENIVGGKLHTLKVKPYGRAGGNLWSGWTSSLNIDAKYGRPMSLHKVSFDAASRYVERQAAAIELNARKFDLLKAIPKDAANRVADYWTAAANTEGATEFASGEPATDGKALDRLAQIARVRMTGTKYEVSIESDGHFIAIDFKGDDGRWHRGEIEVDRGALTFHTAALEAGSGVGKAFYSIANSWAKAIDYKVNADSEGLTAVNTVRRTENAMSSAARSGGESKIEPGFGQRVYGFKPSDTELGRRENLVRIALAQARNVFELAPKLSGIVYDPSTDQFTRNGKSAEDEVKKALADPDVRAFSLGRSSVARAALTQQAIDGNIELPDEYAAPVLYSRKIDEQATGATKAGSVQNAGSVRGSDGLLAKPRRPYQGAGRSGTTLEGLPATIEVDGRLVTFGGFKPAQDAARAYAEKAGIDYDPPKSYVKVDPERGRRIAQAFEEAEHDPSDPRVLESYRAMIDETLAQYRAMVEAGVTVEFNDGGDPYGNPRNAILDVVENNHLYVFSTADEFGSGDIDTSASPMLGSTDIMFGDRPALVNDVFRAVHDYFGHVKEGVGFRADGEENAFQQHRAMFSPLARRALTTETRGQNSVVNFSDRPAHLVIGEHRARMLYDPGYEGREAGEGPGQDRGDGVSDGEGLSGVRALERDDVSLLQPEVAKLSELRGEGNNRGRGDADIARLLGRDGTAADTPAPDRSDRQQRSLREGQRPVGDSIGEPGKPASVTADNARGENASNVGVGERNRSVEARDVGQTEPVRLGGKGRAGNAAASQQAPRWKTVTVAEHNKTASGADTVYAEQKVALLPQWVTDEGLAFSRKRSSVGLLTGTEKLPKLYKTTTRYIAQALHDRSVRIGVLDESPQARDAIAAALADEVEFSLKESGDAGLGWYSHNFPNAVKSLSSVYPELEQQQYRDLLTAFFAIFSNGQRVVDNARMALDAYREVTREGKNIAEVSVSVSRDVGGPLRQFGALVDRLGLDGAKTALLEETTVREMNRRLRAEGKKTNSDYLSDAVVPAAAYYFGPKLGAFYANLMGSEGYLTMDRWWSRTFNRLRGTLIPTPTDISLDKARNALTEDQGWDYSQADDEEVLLALLPYQIDYAQKNYKDGTALERAANTIIKMAYIETKDAPLSGSERAFMIETARRTTDILGRRGYTISVADLQAAAWYYEKRLYAKLGARDSGAIGYEEAVKALAESKAKDDRPAQPILPGSASAAPERPGSVQDHDGLFRGEGRLETDQPEVAFSRGGFDIPDQDWIDRLQATHQDRFNRWKQVIAEVERQGGIVDEVNDFYRAEERYWGLTGARIEDRQEAVKRFAEDVRADGLTLDQVAELAYAQHAPERNAYIASIRPSMPDGGSGMTDAEAAQIVADAHAGGKFAEMSRHAQTMRDWATETRDQMLADGLITPAQHAEWSAMFQSYVPMKGLAGQDEKGSGTGKMFNIRGQESKSAKGRKSRAQDIIEHLTQDHIRASMRGGKNAVLRSFLAFVLDNPDPGLWQVDAVQSAPTLTTDSSGNRIVVMQDKIINDDNTVGVKDGGRQVNILVKDEPLRRQLQGLDEQSLGSFFEALSWASRTMGKLYTMLSPTFALMNATRDFQTGMVSVLDELGARGVGRYVASFPAALAEAVNSELRHKPSKDYQMFRASGGKTSFFGFQTIEELGVKLEKEVAQLEQSKADPRAIGRATLDLIERVNSTIENTTRLAVFKAARRSGKSLAEAAHITKNATVNFNRRGTASRHMGAWFLFYNPAIQGTARVAQAVANPKVAAAIAAGMAGIALLALQNVGMGDDDDGVAWWDKVPSEVKERNFVIVLPPGVSAGQPIPGTKDGRYVKVPMPYGYNFFASLANNVVDVFRRGGDQARGATVGKAAVNLVNAATGAFIPVPELGQAITTDERALTTLFPAAVKPIAQNIINVNSFGRSMYPDGPFDRSKPDSQKYFGNLNGSLWQRAAQAANAATGGNAFEPGWVDMTPASIQNLVRSYGGGPVQFVTDIANSIYAKGMERPSIDARRLPFIKQVWGVIDAETDRMAGYERMAEVEKATAPLDAADKAGDAAAVRAILAKHGPIAKLGDELAQARKTMSELRKDELEILDSKLSDARKVALLEQMNQRRRLALQQFNRAYSSAVRQ